MSGTTLISDIQKGIYELLSTATSIVSSKAFDVPVYFNHAPTKGEGNIVTPYPLIVYNVISSPNFYSMKRNKYTVSRIQISVYANENEFADATDILNELDNNIAFQRFTTNKNLMEIYPADEGVAFFEQELKIYHLTRDYRVWMGN